MSLAVLADTEIESLRFHLGYGLIGVGAYPYTPDGFRELFHLVVAPALQTAEETTAATAIDAATTAVVTPASMVSGIAVNARLVVDAGDEAEVVVVKAVTLTTFTATFTKAHSDTGYPVAVESGISRLRLLLHSADVDWQKLQGPTALKSAGIKQLGKGEIEWFGPGSVMRDIRMHYDVVADQISSLVQVPRAMQAGGGRSGQLEAY